MEAEREGVILKSVAEPEKSASKLSITEQFAARQKVRNCHGAGGSGHISLPMRHH